MSVSRETVPCGTGSPSPGEIDRLLVEQAMPLPPPSRCGRLVWWNETRLKRLRDLVLMGWSDEAIARDLATPAWPLKPATIRSRLSRLGWVVRRPKSRRPKRKRVAS